ncbi:hypothetical protein [Xanthomonas albilineans]|uniref:hypothetical protein n=1 Tax=Xanthomonas albilineans TaxID=29447 RepID=UPI0005F3453E|nr:hypothetical protein [Xanthomonas albilineans]
MLKISKTALVASSIVLCSALIAAADAQSCCPGGGNGSPISTNSLGESISPMRNLSTTPSVGIYQSEINGATYLQIRDITGQVRGTIRRVGNTAKVMPIGKDMYRVKTVDNFDSRNGTVVSNTAYFTVQLAKGVNGDAWTITLNN